MQSVEALSPSTLAPLTRAVSALYEAGAARGARIRRLRRMVAAPPIATVTSLGGVARFLAHHYQMDVVAVDVGATQPNWPEPPPRASISQRCILWRVSALVAGN